MKSSIGLVLGLLVMLAPGQARADGLVGEVSTDIAYLVDYDLKVIRDNYCEVTVTVKAKQAGTFTVVAGFTKPGTGKWLRGAITRAEYFTRETVTLGAGDVKILRIRCYAPPIGFIKEYGAGIHASPGDVVLYR